MLPWAHAAFGYLLYHAYTRWSNSRPRGIAALALAFGTQFPDLVDKPLAWTVSVLPSGRSLGHSAFTLLLVGALLYVVLDARHRGALAAFVFGYATHLVGDGLHALWTLEFVQLGYLFWPLTSAPLNDEGMSFIEFFTSLQVTPWFLFGTGLTLVGLAVWARDGFPGVRDVLVPMVIGLRDDADG